VWSVSVSYTSSLYNAPNITPLIGVIITSQVNKLVAKKTTAKITTNIPVNNSITKFLI